MVLSTACLASSEGFDPKRATFPQHPSALRASEWLDSVNRQALRHFHPTPATTLHFHFYLKMVSCLLGTCVAVAQYPFEVPNTTRPCIRSLAATWIVLPRTPV